MPHLDKRLNSLRYLKHFKRFQVKAIDVLRIEKILSSVGTNKKVLDLGCGDGYLMELIRAKGNRVTGVEIAKQCVRSCVQKGLKVYELDLNSKWAEKIDQKFDVVFAGEVIEHIFDTDKFLSEVKKVTKKNGHIILTTPNLASLGRRLLLLFGKNPFIETTNRVTDAGHIHYFTLETLLKLLNENNFHVKSFESVVVSFSPSGNPRSELVAKIFPRIGNSLIIVAQPIIKK